MGNFKLYIICFLAFILVCVSNQAISQNLGVDILKGINPMYPTSSYWVQVSASAYWLPGIAIVGQLGYGFIEGDRKVQQNAYELLINIGISTTISEILKITINRERPADKYPTEIFVNGPVHGQSFPSGHSSLAFATATTLALDYKRWYIVVPAYLWAVSVGYSRMYLGKHYPGDVLAGAAIGIGSGYFSHWVSKKIFGKKHHCNGISN